MSTEEIHLQVCVRVDTAGFVADGSVKKNCSDCGAEIWVYNKPRDHMVRLGGVEKMTTSTLPENSVLMCILCAMARAKEDHDMDLFNQLYFMAYGS